VFKILACLENLDQHFDNLQVTEQLLPPLLLDTVVEQKLGNFVQNLSHPIGFRPRKLPSLPSVIVAVGRISRHMKHNRFNQSLGYAMQGANKRRA
jgi:hypothetical protein